MTLFTWSQTASSNNTADSTINWREGQAPSTVNNSARAMMAAAAKYRDDISGKLNTGGSSTAYTITSNQTYTSLSDGIVIVARLHAANGAAPTLNVDSLGAKAIRTHTSTAIASGVMNSGGIYEFTYDSGDDCWYVRSFYTVTTTTFADNAFRVQDNGDATKQLAFEISGVTTGNTRTIAVTDTDLSIEGNGVYRAGGTDVAIADGGTGAGTAAAAFTALKQAASDTATGVLEIAVQSEMETASSTTLAVTPGRQHFHPGHAKAWANIDLSGSQALNRSYGITSVADGGTGITTITLATAFSDAEYGYVTGGHPETAARGAVFIRTSAATKSTTQLVMAAFIFNDASFTAEDCTDASIAFFGDL